MYFFFNESNRSQSRTATLAGSGQAEAWDAPGGTIHPLDIVAKEPGHVAVTLPPGPEEARFIVLRR